MHLSQDDHGMTQTSQLASILEAVLFAADRPLSLDDLLALFEEAERPEKAAVREALDCLQADYATRPVQLQALATGFQFTVLPQFSPWVSRLWEERAPRYSRALLETLALVAYRQPITRSEVEEIRGVAVSTNIMRTLLERDWVRVVGHREVPGKPALYATTKLFLDYFGLKRLQDLPPLSELRDLEEMGRQLEQSLQAEASPEDLDETPADALDLPEEALPEVDDLALAEAMQFAKNYDVDEVVFCADADDRAESIDASESINESVADAAVFDEAQTKEST